MLAVIDYIAGVLPFIFAMRDAGIDNIDTRAIGNYLESWAEARLTKEK